MKPVILLVLLVLVAPGSQLVEAGEENFISNQSTFFTLTAAASCPGCDSATLVIPPGSFDSYAGADYSDENGVVQFDLTIGTGQPGTVFIGIDQSIVAFDIYDGTGLEIFAAVHGTRVHQEGSVLATIFDV